MGNFYVNFTVKGDDPGRVAEALRDADRAAVIAPPVNGYIVVFERESDSQDTGAIEEVGRLLSQEADAPVLGILNHDDDILCYWLFEGGQVTDSYNSNPDYFGDDEDGEVDTGGDVRCLLEALPARSSVDRVEAILHGDDYVFAVERHAALVDALGLPECALGMGFGYIERGELPEGVSEDQIIRVDGNV